MTSSAKSPALDYGIQLDTVREGLEEDYCWVHPRAGTIPGRTPAVVLTMQKLLLRGSDVFSPLHEMRTDDLGKTWSGPVEHPDTLGRRDEPDGIQVGICDFNPAWHAATGKLLGTGHTVRYRGDRLMEAPRPREVAYAVYNDGDRTWSPWDIVEMPDKGKFFSSGSGSAQRVDLPDGDVLLPNYFDNGRDQQRSVTVVRCRFDGRTLRYVEHGSEHTLNEGRGLLEPSIAEFDGRFFVTMRASTGKGMVMVSRDGLNYGEAQPWRWDDGSILETGDTQQHWVTHPRGAGLFLAYTRITPDNTHVFRSRAPLFIAQVDPAGPYLMRHTERILVPERGARLGNFQVVNVNERETWVTVAEWMQNGGSWAKVMLEKLGRRRPEDPWTPRSTQHYSRECAEFGSTNAVFASRILWK